MTVSIAQVLSELNITEWVLHGEPTNEAEFNEQFRKVTGADANNTAIESDNPADWGITWAEVEAKQVELQAAQPLKELRAHRNRLLAETDWWASSDLTMTQDQIDYRQALRDITNTYSSLEDVVFPTKPE